MKPRHVSFKNDRYYFTPTKKMRDSGLSGEALGSDRMLAYQRAEELNQAWDSMRLPNEYLHGTFAELISRFEKDPYWYRRLAPATKAEIDYCFRVISEEFGNAPVALIETKHVRNFYNRLRVDSSAHRAKKIHKWLRRLFRYAIEVGIKEYNPAADMRVEHPEGRSQTWTPDQVERLIRDTLSGGKAASGNDIPARVSVALATRVAYDTAQRQQDILSLQWSQYDGEGIEIIQAKTGKKLWLPLSQETRELIDSMERMSIYMVVSEETGRPYDKNTFGRIFRKFRKRAGIEGLTFHDLRRTVATELGNRGATTAEIVSITGHTFGSKVVDDYVKPDREAALRAARKRKE